MNYQTLLFFFLFATATFAQNAIDLQPGPSDGNDAKIFNLDALANYGNDVDLIASQLDYAGEPGTTRSLIKFDLSGLPKGATVTDARLSLYYNHESPSPGQLGANAAVLRKLIVPWEEATVMWAQQPVYTNDNEVFIPASGNTEQDYPDINVTALVKDMVDHPNTSHGFIFMLQDETGVGKSMKFYSSDASVADKRPRLVVTYSTGVATHDPLYSPLRVYPNPFANFLKIETEPGIYEVIMTNPDGKIILTQTIETSGKVLTIKDLDRFISGVYFIRLSGNQNVIFTRAVKMQ